MSKRTEQISKYEAKLKQLKAAEALSAARQKAIATGKERKEELRRKILVGAVVLQMVATGQLDRAKLWEWLDPHLSRKDDRELFEELRTQADAEAEALRAEKTATTPMQQTKD